MTRQALLSHRRLPALGACLLSTALTCASSPAYSFWWLSFIAWLPLIWACDGKSPGRAFRHGWLTGTLTVFIAFGWMTELLVVFGSMPKPFAIIGHLIFSSYHGLMWGLSMGLATWMANKRSSRMIWSLPLAWGLTEAVLPQVFNVHIGYFWASQPAWIQGAEWIGANGVSMIMVLTNTLLYAAIRSLSSWPQVNWRPVIAWVAVMLANPLLGLLRINQIEERVESTPKMRIGVVQGNFGIKSRRKLGARALIGLQEKTAELEKQGAQMVVWGETTYPYPAFMRESTQDFPEGSRLRVRQGFSLPLVFGLVTRKTGGAFREVWNTAAVLEPDGRLGDTYDKVYPLWFGEHAPFVDPKWYMKTFPNASHITRGVGPKVLRVNGYKFGPLICYEDMLPVFTSQGVQQGVHALLAMNNESWFGRSNAQIDHLGLSALRAVEQRRALVRAVNAGVSTYITPTGEMTLATRVTDSDSDGPQEPDGFVADVPMMDPEYLTVYQRHGSHLRWMMALLVLCLVIRARREPRDEAS